MSSEEDDLRARRKTPAFWFDVYVDEYIGDDEPDRTEAREDFDAMIQQIERRVLAQQPCYGSWPTAIEALERTLYLGGKSKLLRKPGGVVTCLEQAAHSPDEAIPLCPPCTARQPQETSG